RSVTTTKRIRDSPVEETNEPETCQLQRRPLTLARMPVGALVALTGSEWQEVY
ncbi:hypothetical protein A2U01_0010712, partial [Trifolium medium]|nr:hypothetical protein [Trifolium medium]